MKISIIAVLLIVLPLLHAQLQSTGFVKLNFTKFEDLAKKMNEDFFNDLPPFKVLPSPSNSNERQKHRHSGNFEDRNGRNSEDMNHLRRERDEHDKNRIAEHRHKHLIKILLISSVILTIFISIFILTKLIRSCCVRCKERKTRQMRQNMVSNNVNHPNALSYGVPIRMNNIQNPQNYWYGVPPQNMPYLGVPQNLPYLGAPQNMNFSYEMIQPQGGFNYPAMGQPMTAPAPQVPQQNGVERRENPYPRI